MDFSSKIAARYKQVVEAQNQWANNQQSISDALAGHVDTVSREVEQRKRSIPGRMGLTEIDDPFWHGVVNTGAKLVAGTAREFGNLKKAVYEGSREADTQLPQAVRDAYNREIQGQATAEDIRLLEAPNNPSRVLGAKTNRQQVQSWFETQDGIKRIGQETDLSYLADPAVDRRAQDYLGAKSADAQRLFEDAERSKANGYTAAAADLASQARSKLTDSLLNFGLENPTAVLGSMAENAPSLIAGAFTGGWGTAASVAGYAADVRSQAIQDYIQKNNGQMPSEDEVRRITALAAGAGSLEYLSDRLTLGAGKVVKSGMSTAGKAVADMEKGAFKTAMGITGKATNNLITRTAASVGLAGVGEYGTEAAQTFLENEAKREDTSLADLHTAGTMGFWAGAGNHSAMGTADTAIASGKAVKQLYGAFKEHQKVRQEQAAAEVAKDAMFADAVKNNTPEVYLNPQDQNFNPVKAMDVLAQMHSKPDATPETKQGILKSAEQVVAFLERAKAAQKNVLDNDGKEDPALDAQIADTKDLLGLLPADDPERAMYEQALVDLEAKKAAGPKTMAPEERKQREARIASVDAQLKQATGVMNMLVNGVVLEKVAKADAPADVASANVDVTTADDNAKGNATAAVGRLRVLAMLASPESNGLSVTDARTLANNSSNPLSQEDREFFTKYADAEEALDALRKKTSQVHKEALYGDKELDQKGLVDYRERFGRAMDMGSKSGVQKEMDGLVAFMANSVNKRAAIQKAIQTFVDSGKKQKQVVFKNEKGSWTVRNWVEGQDTKESLAESKSLAIYGKATALVTNMDLEIKAMESTMAFMETALGKKPQTKPTQAKNTQPAQPGTTGKGSGASQTTQVAPTTTVTPTATTTKESTNGTETTQAVQAKEEGPQASAVTGSAGTAAVTQSDQTGSKSEPSQVVSKTEKKVEPIDTSEGNVEKQPENKQVPPTSESFGGESIYEVFRDRKLETQEAIKQAQKDARKIKRKNPYSLWNAVKRSLNEDELSNVYASDWKKRYTMLKGKPGASLDQLVSGSTLDVFLPENLRADGWDSRNPDLPYDSMAAADYIRTKLQNKDYLTYDTQVALRQLDLVIQELEQVLTPEHIADLEAFNQQQADNEQTAETQETPAAEAATETETGSGRDGEATQDTAEAPVEGSAGQSEAEAATDEERATGLLSVFSDTREATQRIRDSLEQKGKNKPLVQIKNLAQALRDDLSGVIDEFINPNSKKALTTAQVNALGSVAAVLGNWDEALHAILVPGKEADGDKYFHRDVLGYFFNQDGTLDDNLISAISLATLDWAADKANSPLTLTDKEINGLLGRDEDTIVNPAKEGDALRTPGTPMEMVVNDIGSAIIDYLGLKETGEANMNLLPRIRVALGRAGLELLTRRNIVQRNTINMADFIEQGEDTPVDADFREFVRLDQEERIIPTKNGDTYSKHELKGAASRLGSALKGLGDAIPSLMGSDKDARKPSFDETGFTQEKVRKGTTAVPSSAADILDKKNKQPFFLKTGVYSILRQFADVASDDEGNTTWDSNNRFVQALVGMDTRDPGAMQAMRRKSILAKNDGLQDDLDNTIRFIEHDWSMMGLDALIYLGNVMWKNQRVGFSNTIMNPQTSKIVRYLLGREEWKTEVTKGGDNEDSFKLRVLEGFGVKTERNPNAVTLATEWNKLLSNPKIQAAVEALRVVDKDANAILSDEDKQAIVDATNMEGTNMHGLDALIALASWYNTDDGKSFTTYLPAEIDGVNNGPILTQLLMGSFTTLAEAKEALRKGGMFFDGDGFKSFSEYRSQPGQLDLYEETIHAVTQELHNLNKDAVASKFLGAIWNITGQFSKDGKVEKAGRNIIKTPINSLNFGSSTDTAVENMSEDFLETMFKVIEKEATKTPDQRQLSKLVTSINQLLSENNKLDPHIDMDQLLTYSFTAKQVSDIKATFKEYVGEPTKEVLAQRFAAVIHRRNVMNRGANLTYEVYTSVYQALRNDAVQAGIESGELSRVTKLGRNQQIWDLKVKDEKRLQNIVRFMAPILPTAFSEQSGQDGAGLALSQQGRMAEGDKALYRAQVLFTPTGTTVSKKTGKEIQLGTHGESVAFMPTVEGPGVFAQSGSIHSSDSFVSENALNDLSTGGVNLHDAVLTGVATSKQAALNLNKQWWTLAVNYSPLSAGYKALENTVKGMLQALDNPELRPLVLKSMAAQGITGQKLINQLIASKTSAFEGDTMKLKSLQKMELVDQYAFEGGGYKPTAEERAALQDKLEKLNGDVPQDLIKQLQRLDALTLMSNLAQFKESMKDLVDYDLEMTEQQAIEMVRMSPSLLQRFAGILQKNKTMMASLPVTAQQVVRQINDKDAEKLDKLGMALLTALVSQFRSLAPTSPHGLLGVPSNTVDPKVDKLVNSLYHTARNSPDKNAYSVEHLAMGLMGVLNTKANTPDVLFQKQLLKSLTIILPTGTKFEVVTGRFGDQIQDERGRASAWFDPTNRTVFILNRDHVNAKLQTETLLHELTHAALAWAIENPQTPAQKEAVESLTAMMKEAQAFLEKNKDDKLFQKHQHKASNIHEFLAYGLTDESFQRQVISAMGGKQGTSVKEHSSVTQKLKDFVKSLAKLLFTGLSEQAMNKATKNLTTFLGHSTALISHSRNAEEAQIAEGLKKLTQPLNIEQRIDAFTTEQVFSALSANGVSDTFKATLSNRLGDLVGTLHGPFGAIKAQIEDQVGKTEVDAWANAAARGERPFHGKVLLAGVKFSEQEAYVAEQVEAMMQTLLADKSSPNDYLYREVEKLFLTAKAQLKGKIDDDLYRFVFLPKRSLGGKSDYLGRFVALGLSHEGFSKALTFNVKSEGMQFAGKPALERLEVFWRGSLDWFNSMVQGTYSEEAADQRLDTLIRHMVQVEARSRDSIKTRQPLADFMTKMEDGTASLVSFTKKKVAQAAEASFIKDNPFSLVRTAGMVTKIVAGDHAAGIAQELLNLRNKHSKERYGELMELASFMNGNSDMVDEALRVATKIQGQRQHVQADTAKFVMAAFKDGGAYLTDEDGAAITAVLLRTGSHVLKDTYQTYGLHKLLTDSAQLDKAIQKELDALKPYKERHYYAAQARGLANMLQTGWGVDMQMLNAQNIANMGGLGIRPPVNADKAVPHIERLIALYGLKYAEEAQRKSVAKIMETEAMRGSGNGIDTTLDLYKRLTAEAKDRTFRDSEALMMHGYLPEVTDPRVSIQWASTEEEAKELEAQEYVFVEDIPKDPADPDQTPVKMYALKGVGLPRYVSGAFSTTGTAAKGTSKHSNYYNPLDSDGVANMQSMDAIHAKMQRRARKQLQPGADTRPNRQNNTLVPIVNASGLVVDYRYMMKTKNRDTLLNRDNRFQHLLGVMAATTYDKTASREQNGRLVEQLKDLHEAVGKETPERFVFVGSTSQDPVMKEHWNLLPDNTQRDIEAIWGVKGMWVPREMVRPLFGYRTHTASAMFHKENRKWWENGFVNTVNWLYEMYGKHRKGLTAEEAKAFTRKAGVHFRRAEDMWQEVVREKKDAIVVKTGSVLWGNITSNMSLLLMSGMSVKDFIVYQAEALMAVMNYEQDRDMLAQLKLRMGTIASIGHEDEIEAEMARLEDAIARNPAKELIDAGLLPTIVEDIDMEDSQYSYKSSLISWSDKWTSKLHPTILKMGKVVYMSHDTTLYKFLNKATQYSDFVARYAMYKHMTTKERGAMSKQQAISHASASFVNYSNPLPQSLHYLDVMGIAPFTKYALSIQRVLTNLFKKQPLQVLTTLLLNEASSDLPIVTDSSVLSRIGSNPLSTGAAGYPWVIDDTLVINSAFKLFK